ncbi:MAG: 16S rRNA (cytosine(1402)-N(4))-methyltransferase RsmH [Bacteroidales bacterium]|nr:16S rRNA (cytosine(1402)-N(4))-methyltransferase RsmH [Candidatus Cacconaster merdequi]
MSAYHTPVLLNESVSALDIKTDGVYVDATFGGGGHSREILSRLSSKGRLLAFDQDEEAIANAPDDERLIMVHSNFRFIHNFVRYHGFYGVDGILADLGVSSHQFDTSERGFSFRFDEAPLDMRMNRSVKRTAEDIVNSYSEGDLEGIFRLYGEIDGSRKLAQLIVAGRSISPIRTAGDLGRAIESVLPKFARHKYLAKVYQALRMEVNGEMDALGNFLAGATKALKSGGRFAVITYHSLEDRMVKNYFKAGNITGESGHDLMGTLPSPYLPVIKKPILPSEEEISSNTRARSAKLRVAEKR